MSSTAIATNVKIRLPAEVCISSSLGRRSDCTCSRKLDFGGGGGSFGSAGADDFTAILPSIGTSNEIERKYLYRTTVKGRDNAPGLLPRFRGDRPRLRATGR